MISKFCNRAIMKVKHEVLRFEVKKSKKPLLLSNESREQQIIISLTSFPERFSGMDLCLKSLFLQTVKPDKIILWLGSDSVGSNYKEIFSKYIEAGLEINIDEEHNYRSHKKYIYVINKYPEALIITADDDCIYPKDMVESLLKCHEKHPNAIIARRTHEITWNDSGTPKPYVMWNGECDRITVPTNKLIQVGCGGVLYPPNSLHKDYCDFNIIYELAYTADDLWLKIMAVLAGTKVCYVENNMKMPTSANNTHINDLVKENVEGGKNDECFIKLLEHYHLSYKDFCD